MPSVKIDVALGELLDKITVLEIKAERIPTPEARANVERELKLLSDVARDVIPDDAEMADLKGRLKDANRKIWDVVDEMHTFETNADYGAAFVQCARTAYLVNDERAAVKRAINVRLGSLIIEEKFYTADNRKE
jgi:hypothetical protein